MGRARIVALLLVLLLSAPTLAASTARPSDEGAWTLVFDVETAAARRAELSLAIAREDAAGRVESTRDLGMADLPPGRSSREVAFLPGEGPGRYEVALLADGVEMDRVAFDVEDAGASARVEYDVPDEPTWLNLTNDDVNAPNKSKAPGDTLLTRALLSDRKDRKSVV